MKHQRPFAVCCRGLSKEMTSGAVRASVLSGVDFDVLSGDLTFLMGPSGCGKTTLISTIAGILSADAGRVDVFGTNVTSLSGPQAARFRAVTIGFVPQQFHLIPALTAAENASLPLLAQGIRPGQAARLAKEVLESLGLAEHWNKYPAELSVGQQQRVAIARALVHNPKLVICDEPTAALDTAAGAAIMRLLRHEAVKPGRAVLVVTHDPRIEPWADAVAHLRDGRIVSVTRRRYEEAA